MCIERVGRPTDDGGGQRYDDIELVHVNAAELSELIVGGDSCVATEELLRDGRNAYDTSTESVMMSSDSEDSEYCGRQECESDGAWIRTSTCSRQW